MKNHRRQRQIKSIFNILDKKTTAGHFRPNIQTSVLHDDDKNKPGNQQPFFFLWECE